MDGDTKKTAAEALATPVQFLKKVGPQRAEMLARLGLFRAADVLFFFPRDYQDHSHIVTLAELPELLKSDEGAEVSVCGTVEEIDQRNTGTGRSILGVLVRQGSDYLRAVWFNQPHMRKRFHQGDRVLLSGGVRRNGLRWEMTHPRVESVEGDKEPTGQIFPVYRLTEGISQGIMRQIVHGVVEKYASVVEEVLPDDFLDTHSVWPIRAALPQIHNPTDEESLTQARHRFIYQELLVLQLALAIRREQSTTQCHATPLPPSAKIDARIRRLFPFELTEGQNRAIAEVSDDMARDFPMSRLLQGDVGSGKTVVAVYAMLLAVAHGHQAAIMAPTEVLARQHVVTLERMLRHAKVRIGLLTGSLKTAERRKILEEVAKGEIDILIGTQAIVQSEMKFAKLGLVIIDEQHKFGVRQRAMLRHSGLDPHYLVMTATPIPRTMSMTMFGDLDVSTLRDRPPGRQTVHTYLGNEERREQWWEFFRKKLREGRQGFVITPMVGELNSTTAVANLEQAFENLANGELEAFRLDWVHGRMSGEQKTAAMDNFRSGKTQVLIATSVVEVGVDIPNATLMTIEGAERFGLAQLHQLRGRISRGVYPGYLCVFGDPQTEEAQKRLEALAETTDGFRLAEIDFELRGPGDLLGTKQHGLPPLRIADLLRDAEVLQQARADAKELIAADSQLNCPEYAALKRMVMVRYGKALDLGNVG